MRAANDPSIDFEEPWLPRYTLPIAGLAVTCLALFCWWLLTL